MAIMPETNVTKAINIPSLLKIGSGKISKIGKYLYDRKFLRAAVFFSEGIEPIVGKKLYSSFKKYGIQVVHKDTISDIDIENIIHTAFKIPTGTNMLSATNVLIGIGGGKALDYSKYCAHVLKLPFISVPTSVSNDGFCSPNASLLVDGKRKSVKSTIPYGVVADLDVIEGAPLVSLYSGLGDMVSKVTALWDWKQAFEKHIEDYNDFASLITYNSIDILYADRKDDIHSPDFKYKLINSLVLSGVAMEIAGSSRPASGSEHLISHALDSIAKEPQIHGVQVGVSTYLCALLQGNRADNVRNFLTDVGFVDFVSQNPIRKEDFLAALKMAPSIKLNYYTVLSEADSYKRALNFIENDKILKKMIK